MLDQYSIGIGPSSKPILRLIFFNIGSSGPLLNAKLCQLGKSISKSERGTAGYVSLAHQSPFSSLDSLCAAVLSAVQSNPEVGGPLPPWLQEASQTPRCRNSRLAGLKAHFQDCSSPYDIGQHSPSTCHCVPPALCTCWRFSHSQCAFREGGAHDRSAIRGFCQVRIQPATSKRKPTRWLLQTIQPQNPHFLLVRKLLLDIDRPRVSSTPSHPATVSTCLHGIMH